MTIKQKLTQYKSQLNPTREQQDLVWKKISNRKIEDKKAVWQNPILQRSLLGFAAVMFFVVPMINNSLLTETTQSSPNLAPETDHYGYEEGLIAGSSGGNDFDNSKIKELSDSALPYRTQADQAAPEARLQDKQATYTLQGNDPREIKREIEALLAQYNGYLVSSNLNSASTQSATLEMRVPVESFDKFISAMLALEVDVAYENVQITDLQGKYQSNQASQVILQKKIDELKKQIADTSDNKDKKALREQLSKLDAEHRILKNTEQSIVNQAQFAEISVAITEKVQTPTVDFSEWVDLSGFVNVLKITVKFWTNVLAWTLLPGIVIGVYLLWKKQARS